MQLTSYQLKEIEKALNALKSTKKRVVLQLNTGKGKTSKITSLFTK